MGKVLGFLGFLCLLALTSTSLAQTQGESIIAGCALSSGGNPYVVAACIGGGFTDAELDKCLSGESCVGPNNDIRKFLGSIFGSHGQKKPQCGNYEYGPATFNLGFSKRMCSGYLVAFQGDGNLVVYNAANDPLWDSGTGNKGATRFVFQKDGNAVVYNNNDPLWEAGIRNQDGARLALQEDGNIVIYKSDNSVLWTSDSNQSCGGGHYTTGEWLPGQVWNLCSGYVVAFQNDGNLVVSRPDNSVIWSSGTANRGAVRLVMQGDGNFVIYDAQKAIWGTNTFNHPHAVLSVQEDGNLVIRSSSGVPIWDSHS